MLSLRIVSVLAVCCVVVNCKVDNFELNAQTKLCSETQKVPEDTEATVIAKGSIPGADCSLIFNTEDTTGKCGICFKFEQYAFFNTTLASVTLTAGSMTETIDTTAGFPKVSTCSDENMLTLTISHDQSYEYDSNEPGYMFVLDIYNKCGYRGTAKSVSFSDVLKHAKGYHHGQEKDDREMSNIVMGLVVGLCLASVFLVVLLVAWCYVKNSPNRGTSKSAGMPKVGGKRTMDPQASRSPAKTDVEMVAYKKESEPMLKGAAAAVVLSTEAEKPKKRDRKDSGSSSSSKSSKSSHKADNVEVEEKKELIAPTVTVSNEPSEPTESHTTSGGGDTGYGGGSSDHTSSGGGGGGGSDYTSSYGGGGFSSGGGDYSSGGGGGSCGGGGGGGGGGSCGGGGGGDD